MGSGYENRRTMPVWQVVILCLVVAIVASLVVGFAVGMSGNNSAAGDIAENSSKDVTYYAAEGDAVAVGEKVSPSVVFISNIINTRSFLSASEQEVVSSTGSGVIYSEDGYIITNNHVVEGANKISVKLYDGTTYTAEVVGTDSRTDLAVIKIDAQGLTPATFGDSDDLVVGEMAVAIGNPGGESFANSLTQGVISGLNRLVQTEEGQQFELVQTDAAINPGNSGGALCNGDGEVIGINTIKISIEGYEGMGFAIPSNTVLEICQELIEHGQIARPALGVGIVADINEAIAYYNNLAVDYGVMIVPTAGGTAEEAGLQSYDIIIAIDGERIEDSGQLQEIIFAKNIGDEVTVTVQRGNETRDFTVTLGELEQ